MPKAELRLLMQRNNRRDKELIATLNVTEDGDKNPTQYWARLIIGKYFPEFIISGELILLSRTPVGYAAMRSCDPATTLEGYAWQYLEINPIPEPPTPVKRTLGQARTAGHRP